LTAAATDSIESCDAKGNGWRLTFVRRNDRWAHQIALLLANRRPQLLLASVEGADRDVWPSSPPFQELVIERSHDDNSIRSGPAMLLGRAGTGHWSASFELQLDPPRLLVDVACKVDRSPGFLGSTYRCSSPVDQTQEMSIALWRDANGPSVWLAADENLRSELAAENETIVVRPKSAASPATVRWRYRLSIDA
jgi:hypothetical protein